MAMPPGLRKLSLTVHVSSSVGWLGAVGAFLALAVAGLSSSDAATVRGAYVAAEVTTWFVIVPLGVASLVSGVVQSLGSPWGLFRHYWVLTKLLLTVLATVLLLVHTAPIGYVADAAAAAPLAGSDLRAVRVQLVVDAVAAVVVLLATTTLSIFKPRGRTRYGRRKQEAEVRPLPA